MAKVTITAAPSGAVTITGNGFTGGSCQKAIRPLLDPAAAVTETPTAEAYVLAETAESQAAGA